MAESPEKTRYVLIIPAVAKLLGNRNKDPDSYIYHYESELLQNITQNINKQELKDLFVYKLPKAKFIGRGKALQIFHKDSEGFNTYSYDILTEEFPLIKWLYDLLGNQNIDFRSYFETKCVSYSFGMEILTILWIYLLKKYYLMLNLYEIFDINLKKDENIDLIKSLKLRIRQPKLNLNIFTARAIASNHLNELVDDVLLEEMIDHFLQLSEQPTHLQPWYIVSNPKLIALLKARKENNNYGINIYGVQGLTKVPDFDTRFKELLRDILANYYEYLWLNISEESLSIYISGFLNLLLSKYSFFKERDSGDNKLFAQFSLKFINNVLENTLGGNVLSLNPNESELEGISLILEQYLPINRNIHHTREDRLLFIKSFYAQLLAQESRLNRLNIGLSEGIKSVYRGKLLIMMILRFPKIAERYKFTLNIKVSGSKLVIRLLHPNFAGFTLTQKMDLSEITPNYYSRPKVRYKTSDRKTRNIFIDIIGIKSTFFKEKKIGERTLVLFKNNSLLSAEENIEIKNRIALQLSNLIKSLIDVGKGEDAFEALYLLSILKGEFLNIEDFEA